MHELSVASNIIDIVLDSVPENERKNIKLIKIDVGEFSGVESETLRFCFDTIKTETPFNNAELVIKKIPFILYCNECGKESNNELGIRSCGICGSFDTRILSGTEMQITEVELDS